MKFNFNLDKQKNNSQNWEISFISGFENFDAFEEDINSIWFLGDIYRNENNNNRKENFREIFEFSKINNAPETVNNIHNNYSGRFLIILKVNDNFTIITDRASTRELYYTKSANELKIYSGLKTIENLNISLDAFDQNSLVHTSKVYGFRPPKKHTLFKNINKLGAREYFIINKKIEIFKSSHNRKKINWNEKTLSEYKDIFFGAIEKLGSKDGNIVYLSSGWDSTSILAVLVKIFGKEKVNCVIGKMKFSERAGVCNPYEIERAKKIANYYSVDLKIADFNYFERGNDLYEEYPEYFSDNMYCTMASHQWLELARFVSKNYEYGNIFSGEISDGAHNFGFSQQATLLKHPDLGMREFSDKMHSYLFGPSFFKRLKEGSHPSNDEIFNFVSQSYFDQEKNFTSLKDQKELTKEILASLFLKDIRVPFIQPKNDLMVTENGYLNYLEFITKEYFEDHINEINNDEDKLYRSYIELYDSFHWNGGSVQSLVSSEDIFKNIKMNLPFRDTQIIQMLSSMPEDHGRGLEIRKTKYPLKYMLEKYIDYPFHLQIGPHSYLYDTDYNFNHATEWNFHSSFTEYYKTKVKNWDYTNIFSKDTFNLSHINGCLEDYLKGNEKSKNIGDINKLVFLATTNLDLS